MDSYSFENSRQGQSQPQNHINHAFRGAGQVPAQAQDGSAIAAQDPYKGGDHVHGPGHIPMQTAGHAQDTGGQLFDNMELPYNASSEFSVNMSQFRQGDFDFDNVPYGTPQFNDFTGQQVQQAPQGQQPQARHIHQGQQPQAQHLQQTHHTQQSQQSQTSFQYMNQFQPPPNNHNQFQGAPIIQEETHYQAPAFSRPPLHQSSFSYDSSLMGNSNINNMNNNHIHNIDNHLDHTASPNINIAYSYDNSLEIPPYIDNPPKRKPSTHIDNSKTKSSKSPIIIQSKMNTTPKITLPKKSTKPKHSSKLRQGSNGVEDKDSIYSFSEFQKTTEGLAAEAGKKSKKPEFFLPLDNLGGDGAGSGNERQPSGKFLPKFPDFSAFSDSSVATNYERMRLLEPDMGLHFGGAGDDRGGESQFYNFQDNVTPLMQPPGVGGEQGYFDYKGGDGNSPFVLNAGRAVSEGGSQGQGQGQMSTHRISSQPIDDTSLSQYSDIDFHPDIIGFNFDDTNESRSASSLLLVPKDSNNGSSSKDFEDNEENSINSNNGHGNGDLSVPTRPSMERSSSTGSINSLGADKGKKKRFPKGSVCQVCGKYISRDMTRHMRIHDERGRFQCVYPKDMCNHKTGNFNRPYDYKKHLLHMHFLFDDPKGKTAHTLGDKLPLLGSCKACKQRYNANDWLHKHILSNEERCMYIPEGQ
ncbi:hypothetical protein CLIB1423_01S08768 [[Candida] railenensis]|uniref:Uncharacterized protein n=1 Tax=[Candida] railenensis TaxID=45579 RepID=A0A9P0QJP1_9ASCO|nr:hypothetical protein CLIB1423_01S08768 [[Candida] railenensis]